jgi:hypothetical protein
VESLNSKLEGIGKEGGRGGEGFKATQPHRVKKIRAGKKCFILLLRQIKALSGLKIKIKGARILGLS